MSEKIQKHNTTGNENLSTINNLTDRAVNNAETDNISGNPKKKRRFISLNFRLTALVGILTVVIFSIIGTTLWVNNAQKADGLVINLAGRQRMLTQKYTKEVFDRLNDLVALKAMQNKAAKDTTVAYTETADKQAAQQTARLFEVTLNALLAGGKTYTDLGMTKTVEIPPVPNAKIAALLKQVDTQWKQLKAEVALTMQQNPGSSEYKKYLRQIRADNMACLKTMNKAVVAFQTLSESRVTTLKAIQYSFAVLATLVFLIVIYYIRSKITKPLKDAMEMAQAVARGDLTRHCDVLTSDEVGQLSEALNTMCGNLKDMLSEINQKSSVLSQSSQQLLESSVELAEGASQANQQSVTVAAAAEELSINMGNVSKSAETVSQSVKNVAHSIEQMTAAISEVAQSAEQSAGIAEEAQSMTETSNEKILLLDNASKEIDKVIEVILDIAEQTNLLALNATIEAARAGEAGKGFAVVANEVKELAKQTAEATEDIGKRIKAIQETTSDAVSSLSNVSTAVKKVNDSFRTIASAVEEQSITTQEISGNVAQVNAAMEATSVNMEETALAIQEITQNVVKVQDNTKQTANNAENTKQQGSQLSKMAEELKQLVVRFGT